MNAIAFVNDPTIRGTNTASALQVMRNNVFSAANGDRPGIPNIAVVVSDGRSNINPSGSLTEAQLAKDANIRMMSVPMGTGLNMAEMNSMSSSPESSNVFTMANEGQLQNVADRVLDQICL